MQTHPEEEWNPPRAGTPAAPRRAALLALLCNIEQVVRQETGDDLVNAEDFHHRADWALLEYINDPEITAAYRAIQRWYA